MPKEVLTEREFELVNIIGAQLASNQRDLSRHMKMSLGMTNMLLRRLITKGCIRITQLNKKKVQYILTPKGFTEKMRKSVRYTLKTINSIGLVKKRLATLLSSSHCKDARKFYILGGADVAGLIEIIVRKQFNPGVELIHVEALHPSQDDGVTLICREDVPLEGFGALKIVNVIEELSRDQEIQNET